GVAALEIRAGAAKTLHCRQGPPFDRRPLFSAPGQLQAPFIELREATVDAHAPCFVQLRSAAVSPPKLMYVSMPRYLSIARRRPALGARGTVLASIRYARAQCAAQYGLPLNGSAPQKKKSAVLGSPTGHRQLPSVNSSNDRRCGGGMS